MIFDENQNTVETEIPIFDLRSFRKVCNIQLNRVFDPEQLEDLTDTFSRTHLDPAIIDNGHIDFTIVLYNSYSKTYYIKLYRFLQ